MLAQDDTIYSHLNAVGALGRLLVQLEDEHVLKTKTVKTSMTSGRIEIVVVADLLKTHTTPENQPPF